MNSLPHIQALAEEYARLYNPQSVAPFPYEAIVQKHKDLDIIVADLEDDKLSGATLYKDGAFTILISAQRPTTRQHFTLGHELGHYFLHKDLLKVHKGIVDGEETLDSQNMLYRLDKAQSTRVEIEANRFAASLLMPAHLVYQAWDATHNIEQCAHIFQVSVVAMCVRLIELQLVSE